MKKIAYTLIFAFFALTDCNAQENFLQTFYKDQNYTNFVKAVEEGCESIDKENDKGKRLHQINMLSMFFSKVLLKHPDYVTTQLRCFDFLSLAQRGIFVRALYNIGVDTSYLSEEIINESKPYLDDLSKTKITKYENPVALSVEDIDYLWACFFASGDKEIIYYFLQILDSNDEALLLADLSLNNPDSKLVSEAVESAIGNDIYFLCDYLVRYTMLWSLGSNCTQDSDIADLVYEVMKENPDLNFLTKLDRLKQETSLELSKLSEQ